MRATRAGLTGVGRGGARLNPGAAGDCVRLGGKATDAGAHRVAEAVDGTLGVWAARGGFARVGTRCAAVVLANVAAAAIRIALAFSPTAGDGVRLGDVGGQAAADGVAVARYCALRVGAAWRWIAGIRLVGTAVVQADAAAAAIRITLALPLATGNGVGHGDKAGQAATDRVAQAVGHTLGVRPARGR